MVQLIFKIGCDWAPSCLLSNPASFWHTQGYTLSNYELKQSKKVTLYSFTVWQNTFYPPFYILSVDWILSRHAGSATSAFSYVAVVASLSPTHQRSDWMSFLFVELSLCNIGIEQASNFISKICTWRMLTWLLWLWKTLTSAGFSRGLVYVHFY